MSVAERNSGSGLTNAQAALFAAVNLVTERAINGTPERVTRVADTFLVWLDAHAS